GRRKLGGLAQPRQYAIARRAVGRELGESGDGLLVLARFGQRHGLFKSGPGLRCLLGLPPLVTAPSADADDEQGASGDKIIAVTLPQLFELFAAYFFVDFMEKIAQAIVLALWSVSDSRGL